MSCGKERCASDSTNGGPWVACAAVRVVRLGERAAPDGAEGVGMLPLSACPSGWICT